MGTLTGGCLCGGVRYEVEEPLTALGDCHCIDCRRSSGAPYVTWGTVPRSQRRIQGATRRVHHAGRVRVFAACCGTHLFFEEDEESDTIDVTIATLDDPVPHAPAKAIWLEDHLPWVPLNPAVPKYAQSSAAEGS